MRFANVLCLFAEMRTAPRTYSFDMDHPRGHRRYSSPILLRGSDPARALPPVALSGFERGRLGLLDADAVQPKSRVLDEDRLQNLLADNPALLPIQDIEPAFGPAICLGREVGTGSGPMDLLYISPKGYLTIVETKLWRNPQARREVVAQIVDYAKELSRWSVAKLTEEVSKHPGFGPPTRGLFDFVRTKAEALGDVSPDETTFYDTLGSSLARGRFLLIIAGDGIRDNVEAMADFFNDVPQLLFTLALVELVVFELDRDSLIVVPHVLLRTREITRSVVRIEGSAPNVTVGPATPRPMPGVSVSPTGDLARRTLTEQDFLDALSRRDAASAAAAETLFDALKLAGFDLRFGTASVVAKLPDPAGSAKPLTVFTLYTDGTMQFGWMPDQLASMGRPSKPAEEFYEKVVALFGTRKQARGYPLGLTVATVGTRAAEFLALTNAFADAIRSTNPDIDS